MLSVATRQRLELIVRSKMYWFFVLTVSIPNIYRSVTGAHFAAWPLQNQAIHVALLILLALIINMPLGIFLAWVIGVGKEK